MSLFTVQPNAFMSAEETAPPPPPCISPEECNATVNEWGVWPAEFFTDPAHDQTITCSASAAEIESRVRCGKSPVNRNCTALVPDSKCVFKWAFATTAAATACSCTCCLLGTDQCEMRSSSSMSSGMSISIGSSSIDDSGSYLLGDQQHDHGCFETSHGTSVQYFVEFSDVVV
ncbi:DUF281 domain-containing protein [Caenorhabditis elegans]|uniref:DUF281 domain-containing protein n=1 Tax=Caenorhabditis elegans TaxID=6239 RepID=A0A1E1GUV3_CAEEL|nr:DUF281 domain-containing protein [Caenorhabditis elegans]CAA96633.2 DUF281 domain-containing protein [Caenorhabditis elegans]|eukprot:NP_001334192.1 Uncharacterized protein CELE_F17C11.26 [Caenorhabditis elegans]